MLYAVEMRRSVMESWRLKTDGTWRELTQRSIALQDSDQTYPDSADLTQFRGPDLSVSVQGRAVIANPKNGSTGDGSFITFRLFRRAIPQTPTLDGLIAVIGAGQDRHNNSLVLRVDGRFALIKRIAGDGVAYDPTIAVRMETLGARNGYVGPESAKDLKYWKRNFRDFLDKWAVHLETGRLNIYDDTGTTRSDQQVNQRVQEASEHLLRV